MGYIKQVESGRSMVEMLGVLSVMGVLSVGGIVGFRYAMDKREANDIKQSAVQTYMMVHSYMMRHTALSSGGVQPVLNQVWGTTNYTPSFQSAQDDKYSFQLSGVPQGSCRVLYGDSGFDGKAIELVNGTCDSGDENTLKFLFDFSAIDNLSSSGEGGEMDDNTGDDSSDSSLCNGHGNYREGMCICETWYGGGSVGGGDACANLSTNCPDGQERIGLDGFCGCQCDDGRTVNCGELCDDENYYYCTFGTEVGSWGDRNYPVCQCENGYYGVNNYGGVCTDSGKWCSQFSEGYWYEWAGGGAYCVCNNSSTCDVDSDGQYCCDDYGGYYCDHGTINYAQTALLGHLVCNCEDGYYGANDNDFALCDSFSSDMSCSKNLRNGHWQVVAQSWDMGYCVCNDGTLCFPQTQGSYCCDAGSPDDDYYYCSSGTEVGRWGDRNYPVCRCENGGYGVQSRGTVCDLGFGKYCSQYNAGDWYEWAEPGGDGYCVCDNSSTCDVDSDGQYCCDR